MAFEDVLGGIGAALGVGQTIYNASMSRQQYEYERWAQQQTWNREDNAVQRRVADLKAAGLNPVLAAGSAAASSSPIAVHAPQVDASAIGDQAYKMMALMTQKKDIARTEAETNLVQQQEKKAAWDVAILNGMQNYMSDFYPGLQGPELLGRWELEKKMAELGTAKAVERSANTAAAESSYNLDLAKTYGIRSGPSGAMDFANEAELFNKFLNQRAGSKVGAGAAILGKLLQAAGRMKP